MRGFTVLTAVLLASLGLTACSKKPSCSDAEALDGFWKKDIEPRLTLFTRLPGAPPMTLHHQWRDIVTVSQGDRYVRCRAVLEIRFEPPMPNTVPMPPIPAPYVVELTDDGRLLARDDDGRSRP